MKRIPNVNNDVYRTLGDAWWDDDVGEFSTLRFWINPIPSSRKTGSRPEMRGIVARRNPLATLLELHRCTRGKLTFKELGRRLDFQEGEHLEASYMGYAVKAPR